MRPTVYLDTTIPSYYFETREDPIVRAHQLITVQWWEEHQGRFEFVTSQIALDELASPAYPPEKRELALELMNGFRLLELNEPVFEIAAEYAEQFVMPRKDLRDAVHLAVACYYRVKYLATWNCAHLANAHKRRHLEYVNTVLGGYTPLVLTPEEILVLEGDRS